MSKSDIDKGFDNFRAYEEKVKDASQKELEMFEAFYNRIKDKAEDHKQVTLNNLRESKQTLSELKAKAEELKDSVFYHDETVIVDRQKIISRTEHDIHKENRVILDYEFAQADERIDSLDYLNKASIQTKLNFFEDFRNHYAKQIFNQDLLYHFFQKKTDEFKRILDQYHQEVLEDFHALDNEINDMDMQISFLIQEKNEKLNAVNRFYKEEMSNYLDNQLTFSTNDDPTSLEMQALISDKIAQLENFKKHLLEQEEKVKQTLNDEYMKLYLKTLDRLLKKKGNLLFEDSYFFYHPEAFIQQLKQDIVEAEAHQFVSLKNLIKTYNKAIKYKSHRAECERKAKQLTKKFLKVKKAIFLEYQKDSRHLILQLEHTYKLYLELIKIDPFLAQIIGDNTTKIIKDELNFLSILQVNKEHKINVNFDIKTQKLKQGINAVEAELAYHSERLMLRQDIELIDVIKDIELFFINHQYDAALVMNALNKEKLLIERLETAINYHIDFLIKESNVNRKFLSMITQILNADIRTKESHNIHVVDAAAKIKLALKEYDILALHYKTMYENEKRFLVIQSHRVNNESDINNEFILTTFTNQMRFANEQIQLANDEYKLRVESIMTAINEERNYYFDMIEHKMRDYKERQKIISDEYQAKLYHDSYLLTETEDKHLIKALEKQIERNKQNHDQQISEIEALISKDQVIADAKRRLRELDAHLEVALDDAQTLRDDTIQEMSELYAEAKTKHDLLKPYLENKVNMLDPTFFNGLEKIKKRHEYKLKVAQIELEDKTKEFLDQYLKIYFEEQPEINRDLYLSQIEELENERQAIRDAYGQKIEKSDLVYHTRIAENEKLAANLLSQTEEFKKALEAKHMSSLKQKIADLDSLEKQFAVESERQKTTFASDISQLTNEYAQSLIDNQKYYQNLTGAFDKIIASYEPYIKKAKQNHSIKMIIKETQKQMKKEQKAIEKKLKKASKSLTYLD